MEQLGDGVGVKVGVGVAVGVGVGVGVGGGTLDSSAKKDETPFTINRLWAWMGVKPATVRVVVIGNAVGSVRAEETIRLKSGPGIS